VSQTVQHFMPTTSIEDKIAYLLADKDKEAVTLVFEHYGSLLFNIINRVVHDDEMSEDVLQTVLLKVWENGLNFDASKGALFTWLARISRNAAIDKTRTKDFRLTQESKQGPEVVNISESVQVEDDAEKIYLRQLISNLSADHQQLINMSFFEGYTHKEICEKLEVPLGTVKTRIRLAIKHLRSII